MCMARTAAKTYWYNGYTVTKLYSQLPNKHSAETTIAKVVLHEVQRFCSFILTIILTNPVQWKPLNMQESFLKTEVDIIIPESFILLSYSSSALSLQMLLLCQLSTLSRQKLSYF